MDNKMFCFQCEQTAGCVGCKGAAGVCGKKADTAQLQDCLTGALIGLARATEGNEHLINSGTDRLIIEGLFTTITNVNFNNATISALIDKVHTEKNRLVPECLKCASSCGRNSDYDMRSVWEANEDIRSLKSLILFGIRGMAAYAYHASVLGYHDETVNRFFYKALFAVGMDWDQERLLPIVLEVGAVNLRCMELLDRANTETYGTPVPTKVPLTVEKGPFIVISGHDLYDLKQLLEQTKGRGNQYLYARRDAAGPRLPRTQKIQPSQGQLWYGMAKPAERICESPCAGSFHNKLSDAAQSQLCGSSVYHGSRVLPGNRTYRRR